MGSVLLFTVVCLIGYLIAHRAGFRSGLDMARRFRLSFQEIPMQVQLACTVAVWITVTQFDKNNDPLPGDVPITAIDVSNQTGDFGKPVQDPDTGKWSLTPGAEGATATLSVTFTAADNSSQTISDNVTLVAGAPDHYGIQYTPISP